MVLMVQSVLAAVNYGVELQRIQQSDYKLEPPKWVVDYKNKHFKIDYEF